LGVALPAVTTSEAPSTPQAPPAAERSTSPYALAAIATITILAAVFRFASLRAVPLDPFYDAAVRSMSLSLHNFFFGVYEPGGSVSIDKPPIDLWLQVISVKLFGFGSVQLKLPQAFCGTLAVPLMYDAIRRIFGTLAGLASAIVLAVLPIAVLTARSDTMDSVMMALSVLALWLLVRYAQDHRARWLYLAAAAMGLAFNVKLFEALVAVPALALTALLVTRVDRVRRCAVTAVVFIAVATSWLVVSSLFPASQRPYAIGSTNGSAWNAAFVFNGYDRIAKPSTAADLSSGDTGTRTKPAGNSELQRSAVPIGKPTPLRLFDHNGPLSGLRLGYVLLASLLLGIPALVAGVRARTRRSAGDDPPGQHARFGVAAGLLVWLATGFVLFTAMARLHPRYTEGFTPAVAAAAGIGLAWVAQAQAQARGRPRTLLAAIAALALVLYGHYLLGSSSAVWQITALAGAAAVAAALVLRRHRLPALIATLGVALLLLPIDISTGLIENHEFDAGRVGVMPASTVSALSSYLRAHQGSARYEFAAEAATRAAAMIVKDARPVLVLTSFNSRPLTSVQRLAQLVAAGQVRYALLGGGCGPHTKRTLAVCSPQANWVRAHGTDVSLAAGLTKSKLLWRL
jgi:4-amino-4-deoxy-L-arabinose transferase-like glycosyltransferase